MPNWRDALNALGQPLVPKGVIRGLQESLAPGSSEELVEGDPGNLLLAGAGLPSNTMEGLGAIPDVLSGMYNHPMETAAGFGSGALEGLRSLSSPASLAGIAALAVPGLRNMGRGGAALEQAVAGPADEAARMGRQAFDVVDDVPTPQVKPSMADVDAVIGDAQRQMARVPNATGRYRGPGAQPASARSMPPEFVPRGGEGVYNAGRPTVGPSTISPPPRVTSRGAVMPSQGDAIADALAARFRQGFPGR